ncbi:MAG TPA: protein kinase [Verrucomicrobiaceae bacterium]
MPDDFPEGHEVRPGADLPRDVAPGSPGSRTSGQWLPPSPEALQEQLPHFRMLDLLGCGGMGAVYKGWQSSLERYVAIKILPPSVIEGDTQFAARFKQEAKTMARFQHPGIVSIYDAGETTGGLLYIVMEFIEGTDVNQMLRAQGRIAPAHALAITAHVCDALQYAHSHGVIHRDIKPANVLINMEGAVKVGDFGLAKSIDLPQATLLTMGDMAMGTPDFVAPEALLMGVETDSRADLYAVGVMLYDMLTGQLPRGIFEMPSELTRGDSDVRFDAIIARALEQDREKRYQSASEIRQDLDVILTTPKLVAQGASSSAIPKHELARVRQQMLAKKPVARRPGQPAHQQTHQPARQVVNYVPQKKPVLPAMIAGVVLAVGGFFAWQKFGKKNIPLTDPSAIASTTAATPVSSTGQLEGVYLFGGHRYKFLPGPFDKEDDSSRAAAVRGHLVTINSAEEQKWIEQTFGNLISINSRGQCRADGFVTKEGIWSWRNREPWNYTNWAPGFPGANKGGFLVLKNVDGALKWQSCSGSDKRSAIIEWDDTATPIPIAALFAALAPTKPAPSDALAFGGHRYKFISGNFSWNEANSRAADLGGHLATLNTREEDEWVARTFANSMTKENGFHFGAYTNAGHNGTWFWITGEPWSFERWKDGKSKDRTDPGGAVCFSDGKGGSNWRASWSPGSKGATTGEISRFTGFLVEWDDNQVAGNPASSPLATLAPVAGETLVFGGHRYQLVKERTSWPSAKVRAEAMGAHLATITSKVERDAVSKKFAVSKGEDSHVFLGGLQEKSGGPWVWVTGEPFDMGLWGEHGPDGSGPRLTFYADKLGKSWDDVSLNNTHFFLVEWDEEKAFIASTGPPGDSLAFGGHRYKAVQGEVSWDEAKILAEKMGGHLATLTTREEDDWARGTFIDKLPEEKLLHIGGQRISESDTWHWVTGEPWSYTHWREKATTTPGGIGYIKAIEGNQRGWNSWDTRKTVTAQSGPLQGKSRIEGFLVEWDKDDTPKANIAGTAKFTVTNLLAGVDVKKGSVRGRWELQPEGLVGALGGTSFPTFEFDHSPPADYEFEIEFTITEGNREVEQILPTASGPILWRMGMGDDNSTPFGFGPYFDGKNLNSSGRTEAMTRLPRLGTGERHRCVIYVRRNSLRAEVDGKEVVRWSGDLARLRTKTDNHWDLADPGHLGVGVYVSGIIFHKVELRMDLASRLARIEAQFNEAYERDVSKGSAGKAVADLDKKYLAALNRALADATKSGKLDDVMSLREEVKRVGDQAPLSDADPVNIIASLKKLRDTYRKSVAPLRQQREALAKPVYARYDDALAAYEAELTRSNQIEDALIVKAKRNELVAMFRPASNSLPPVSTAASTAVAGKTAAPSPVTKSKSNSDHGPKTLSPEMLSEAIPTRPFTPAEAAQWALSLGGSARIKRGSGESELPDVSRIPKGNFTLLSLKLGEKQPLHVVSLAALSGLTELRELILDNNLITDAGLAFLPKLPKLSRLSVAGCELTDQSLEKIAKLTALTELDAQNNHITGSGLENLTNLPGLAMLKIGSVDLTDEGVPYLASLGALHRLDLDSGKPLKCENLAPLSGIKKLKTLVLGASATDSTVRSLKSMDKLDTLLLYHAPISDYAMDGVAGMKGLKELNLSRCPNLTDIGLTKLVTLKSLVKLDVGHTRLTDAGFQTLSMKLSEVNDLNCTSDALSDAGLSSLTNFRKLSRLVVPVRLCTEAGAAQIRRASANLKVISIDQMETLSPARIEAIKKMLPNVDWARK